MELTSTAIELIARSRRLGADRHITNFGGGNTSAKGLAVDPVTGKEVEVLWIKGSGGDLATLTLDGLAALRLDRLRMLAESYAGDREADMFALLDYCLHGRGGAAPSIDTPIHALLPAKHVDHLHPDVGIAIATAADGEAITHKCFGARVGWIPWQRPGFELGIRMADFAHDHPRAIGCVMAGHGIAAWADTSDECEARSLKIVQTARDWIAMRGRAEPFGPKLSVFEPLPKAERDQRAAALLPAIRGLVSSETAQIGHYDDSESVLDFLSRAEHPRLVALGTSCPDHFLRTKVRPLLFDLPPSAALDEAVARLRELIARYREEYRAYYQRHALPDTPQMRSANPAIVLVPGVGMFGFGKDATDARIASEFFGSAIQAIRGAEAISRYDGISEDEKFRIEYWALEEAKLARMPKPRPLSGQSAFITGAGSGIGRAIAHRLAIEGACVVVADRDGDRARSVAKEIGDADIAIALTLDIRDESAVRSAFEVAVRAFGGVDIVVNNAGLSISKPLLDTGVADWDLVHDVMAKGSFLVSREAARIMIAQGLGGDIIYVVSKNAIVANTDNIAYGAAKADQAHQVRLLATELGQHGIRVNGINPDAVVRGSGIFAGDWGAQRAAIYGVRQEDLGAFYAKRTLLKREVLPEHVAAVVFALVGGDFSQTTGHLIPVDAGVPAAFLR